MRKILIFIILLLFLVPVFKINGQSSTAGFIQGNIWYSKDPFYEGDKIKIYTVVFNPDQRQFLGTVTFFDNDVFLGKKDFSISSKGVQDISIEWTAVAGDHKIFGKIENARFLVSAGKYENVYLKESETEKSSRTVSKKFVPAPDSEKPNEEKSNDNTGIIGKITNTIIEKTPDIVSGPVNNAIDTVENFRTNKALILDAKAGEAKNELKEINKENSDESNMDTLDQKNLESSFFVKPFQYLKFFFFALVAFIFENKFIFYIVLVAVLFLILRFIWRLIF